MSGVRIADGSPFLERYRSGHNEAVLKTVWVKARVGSNPTLSAVILIEEKYSSGRRGSPAKGVDLIRMRGFKSLLLRRYMICMVLNVGDWSSGMTVVSKTISGGSIPSSPAMIKW